MRRRGCSTFAKLHTRDPNVVESAVRAVLPPTVETDMVVVDCRPLSAMKDRHERCHLGTHPANFQTVVRSATFRHVIAPVAQRLSALSRTATGPERPLTLAFLSCSGRHRSVACARVAAEVVMRDELLIMDPPINLTLASRSAGHCDDCEACSFFSRKWALREAALNDSVAVWRQIAGCTFS